MASKSVNTMTFSFPPDAVLKVLTDPDFQVANFKAQGNPEAKVNEASRTDDRLVIEAEVVEYAKGVTGVDKSKTEITHTTTTWNLADRTCEWTYRSPHGDRVQVWGNARIEPAGENTRLTEEFHVKIKIPLVGGKIEKLIMKEVEAFYPRYEKLVQEHLDKG